MGLFGKRNAKWEAAGYVKGKHAIAHARRPDHCKCHCTPCQCTTADLQQAQREANTKQYNDDMADYNARIRQIAKGIKRANKDKSRAEVRRLIEAAVKKVPKPRKK